MVRTKLLYMGLTEEVILVASMLVSTWMVVRYALVGTVVVGYKHVTKNTVDIAAILEADEVVVVWLGFSYFRRFITGVSLDNVKLLV